MLNYYILLLLFSFLINSCTKKEESVTVLQEKNLES